MKLTVWFKDVPEGAPHFHVHDCGFWEVGRAGELRIYNDDAKPGIPKRRYFLAVPPKPPTIQAIYAPGVWGALRDGEP
jgi:hypothetical protein